VPTHVNVDVSMCVRGLNHPQLGGFGCAHLFIARSLLENVFDITRFKWFINHTQNGHGKCLPLN
jgi:hypothetical protein